MDLPAKHVENTLQSVEFWTNKVLLADRSAPSQEWVRACLPIWGPLPVLSTGHHQSPICHRSCKFCERVGLSILQRVALDFPEEQWLLIGKHRPEVALQAFLIRCSEVACDAQVRALKALLKGLATYVGQHHIAGPAWNPNGAPLSQFTPGAAPSGGALSLQSFSEGANHLPVL